MTDTVMTDIEETSGIAPEELDAFFHQLTASWDSGAVNGHMPLNCCDGLRTHGPAWLFEDQRGRPRVVVWAENMQSFYVLGGTSTLYVGQMS